MTPDESWVKYLLKHKDAVQSDFKTVHEFQRWVLEAFPDFDPCKMCRKKPDMKCEDCTAELGALLDQVKLALNHYKELTR